jgi:hypothetical protein
MRSPNFERHCGEQCQKIKVALRGVAFEQCLAQSDYQFNVGVSTGDAAECYLYLVDISTKSDFADDSLCFDDNVRGEFRSVQ